MTKHLWEVEHPYYCNDSNYYSDDRGSFFKSWAEFMAEMGAADLDFNLLFRWDWSEEDVETGEPTYAGDDYYRNGKLKLYIMHQRKGRYVYVHVDVCRADEPAVLAYLQPRLAHLKELWAPLV